MHAMNELDPKTLVQRLLAQSQAAMLGQRIWNGALEIEAVGEIKRLLAALNAVTRLSPAPIFWHFPEEANSFNLLI
jgi:hypothetical protein